MVPLKAKNGYLLSLINSKKLEMFKSFIFEESISEKGQSEESINELDEIIYGMINSITLKEKKQFLEYYGKKNKSQPSKDSRAPYIYDDFFIFTTLVGLTTFGVDKDWLRNILNVRNESSRTSTFKNILEGDFINSKNEYPIVYCFFKINNSIEITDDFSNLTFQQINQDINLFREEDDFKIICSIRAYEAIISEKEIPSGSEIFLLKQFNESFQKRIKITTWIVGSLLWVIVFLLIYWIYSKLNISDKTLDRFGVTYRILAIIGISQLTNLTPLMKNISQKTTLWLYGYPKELKNNQ